jgi:exosortase/archaeosortase family protein
MSEPRAPRARHAARRVRENGRGVRLVLASVLFAAAVSMVVFNAVCRSGEAWLAQHVFSFVLHTNSVAVIHTAAVYLNIGSTDYFGLKITAQCSAFLIMTPLFLVAAVMCLRPRFSPARLLGSVAVFAVLVLVVNQIRLVVIAALTDRFGLGAGFGIAHNLVGAVVMLLGLIGGIALFVKLVTRVRKVGAAHA